MEADSVVNVAHRSRWKLFISKLSEKKWFTSNKTRIILTVVVSTILDIAIAIIFGAPNVMIPEIWKISILVVCLVIISFLNICYKDVDTFMSQGMAECKESLEAQITDLQTTISKSESLIAQSDRINRCYVDVLHSLSFIHDYVISRGCSLDEICEAICRQIHDILIKAWDPLATYEVSYVRTEADSITMNAFTNGEIMTPPRRYRAKIPVLTTTNPKTKQYVPIKIILKKEGDPVIFLTRDEIIKEFLWENKRSKKDCKYMQYIGVPLMLSTQRIVGVIQVVTFTKDGFAPDKESCLCLAKNVIKPIAYLPTSEYYYNTFKEGASVIYDEI